MIESSLDKLQPGCRQRAQAWLEMVQAYVLPIEYPGYKVRVTETLRTRNRQAELAVSGASGVPVGYHNFGRALDFIALDEHGVIVHDGAHPIYLACGLAAEALGFKWGGRFQQRITLPDGTKTFKPKPDYDHIEYHPGVTIDDLIKREAAGLET